MKKGRAVHFEKALKSGIVKQSAIHDMAADSQSAGWRNAPGGKNGETVTHGLLAYQIRTGLLFVG